MDITSALLKSLIDEYIQRALEKNELSEELYKNLNKHTECTKCFDKITRDNYKKNRSICRKCYSKYMLEYNSNRRGEYNKLDSSRKEDVSSKADSSNNFDSLNKQVRSVRQNKSKKQASSNKQGCSNKQDISINNIIDSDPILLCDKLREILSKPDMVENDYTMSKMILDELLRTKCISRKDYNAICKNIGLI